MFGYFVAWTLGTETIIVIVSAVAPSSRSSNSSSGLIVAIVFCAIACAMFGACLLVIAYRNLKQALSSRNPDHAVVSLVCANLLFGMALCWVAGYRLISWIPLVALLHLTMVVVFVWSAVRKPSLDSFVEWLARFDVRRESLPFFVCLTLSWIHLANPQLELTWTAVFAPFCVHAALHICYLAWLCFTKGIGMGWPPMITYVHMTNCTNVWSNIATAKFTQNERLHLEALKRGIHPHVARLRADVLSL